MQDTCRFRLKTTRKGLHLQCLGLRVRVCTRHWAFLGGWALLGVLGGAQNVFWAFEKTGLCCL